MSRMYLVRRENNRFIGPMTLSGFRDRLRKMEFGVQDEVCGHCSPWVVLDREDKIRRSYPELAEVIAAEMPAAWREMTGHARIVTKNEQYIRPEKRERKQRRSKRKSKDTSSSDKYYKHPKSSGPKIFGALMVLVIGVVVWFALQKNKDDGPVAVGELMTLAGQNDPNRFLNEMGLKLVPIVARVNKDKDERGVFLPYLRMYAFYTSGTIENLPVKTLRGSVPLFAPQDCSVDAWKRRWVENKPQIALWINSSELTKNIWTKTLSWDPHWIKRRQGPLWYRPRNWFEGCLLTASAAIRSVMEDYKSPGKDSVASNPDRELLEAVHRRLLLQIDIIQKGRSLVSLDASSTVGMLSCMEQASNIKDVSACQIKTVDLSLQQMFDEHYAYQVLRLALMPSNSADAELQSEWTQLAASMAIEDSLSKLDYGVEVKFLRELQANGFKFDGVSRKVVGEFGDVVMYSDGK